LWDFLVDYSNDLDLCGDNASATLISGELAHVGATYLVVMWWEGLKGEFETRLESIDRPTSMTWVSSTSQSGGSAVYTLVPSADGGTDMTLEMTLTMRGPFTPLEPFAWSLLSRFAEKMLNGLKRAFPQGG
jgi:hypothetical protein